MNGAESLIRTAVAAGIDTCFTNPGTTEIPLVRAIDEIPGIRPVLCLFEGVCTGAADGFGRLAGRPALTLLHLGPGFANGIAYLHDARRARTPVVNLVGEHATWHQAADPPLHSDIESLARPVSAWLRRSRASADLSVDLREAVAAAAVSPGRIATLIVAHDLQLGEGGEMVAAAIAPQAPPPVSAARLAAGFDKLRAVATGQVSAERVALLLGARGLGARGLAAVARIARRTGICLLAEAFPARWERGQGRPVIQRLPYFPEQAIQLLSPFQTVMLAGAPSPVSFFGYPGVPGHYLRPEQVQLLAGPEEDVEGALEELAGALEADHPHPLVVNGGPVPLTPVLPPPGRLTGERLTATVAALLPPQAIVMDEGNTSTGAYTAFFQGAAPHSYLTQPGGAIGLGLPCAIGAALAAPGRPVVVLQADGSGMYTIQSLWTMAREGLEIKTIICNNSGYRIVELEMRRAGIDLPGPRARSMMDIDAPAIDWVSLARGLGLPAVRVETVDELVPALQRALAEPGPCLIEAVLELA
jgi:acetolactate synthase-1/2/3 large subunit